MSVRTELAQTLRREGIEAAADPDAKVRFGETDEGRYPFTLAVLPDGERYEILDREGTQVKVGPIGHAAADCMEIERGRRGDALLGIDPDARAVFEDFWRPIVMDGSEWNHAQVMRELADYRDLLQQVPLVYDHVTGGRVTKPNTMAFEVKGEADQHVEELVRQRIRDEIDAIEAEDMGLSPTESMWDAAQDAFRLLLKRVGDES